MISKPTGYDDVKDTNVPKLGRGNYICKITNAKEIVAEWDTSAHFIRIAFDIAEGEFAGYFKSKFAADSDTKGADAKWKGTVDIRIPASSKDGETEEEQGHRVKQTRTFKRAIANIEEANEGYHWDWNELGLKGKTIGVKFQPTAYSFVNEEGKEIIGEWQKPKYICSVERIKNGKEGTLELYDPDNLMSKKIFEENTSDLPEPEKYIPQAQRPAEATTTISEDDLPF